MCDFTQIALKMRLREVNRSKALLMMDLLLEIKRNDAFRCLDNNFYNFWYMLYQFNYGCLCVMEEPTESVSNVLPVECFKVCFFNERLRASVGFMERRAGLCSLKGLFKDNVIKNIKLNVLNVVFQCLALTF